MRVYVFLTMSTVDNTTYVDTTHTVILSFHRASEYKSTSATVLGDPTLRRRDYNNYCRQPGHLSGTIDLEVLPSVRQVSASVSLSPKCCTPCLGGHCREQCPDFQDEPWLRFPLCSCCAAVLVPSPRWRWCRAYRGWTSWRGWRGWRGSTSPVWTREGNLFKPWQEMIICGMT